MTRSLENFALLSSASLAIAVHFLPFSTNAAPLPTINVHSITKAEAEPAPPLSGAGIETVPKPVKKGIPASRCAPAPIVVREEPEPLKIIRVRQTIQRNPPLLMETRRHLALIAQARAEREAVREAKEAEENCRKAKMVRRSPRYDTSAREAHYRQEQIRAQEEQQRRNRERSQQEERERQEDRRLAAESRRREEIAARERAYILSKLAEEHPPVLIDNASRETKKNVREFLERNEQAAKRLLQQSRR